MFAFSSFYQYWLNISLFKVKTILWGSLLSNSFSRHTCLSFVSSVYHPPSLFELFPFVLLLSEALFIFPFQFLTTISHSVPLALKILASLHHPFLSLPHITSLTSILPSFTSPHSKQHHLFFPILK